MRATKAESFTTELFEIEEGCFVQAIFGIDARGEKHASVRFVREELVEKRGFMGDTHEVEVTESIRLPFGFEEEDREALGKLIAALQELHQRMAM